MVKNYLILKLTFLLLIIISVLTAGTPAIANTSPAAPTEVVTAKSYILVDADSGKILKARDEHLRLPPASMTKLMTLVLAMEAIENGKAHKDDPVKTSEHAWAMGGSEIYLTSGEVMTLNNMLTGIAVASANDASVAVAEYLAGSEESFVARMNAKARDLGMKDTHFNNANGLPTDGHYSSAYDMAVLARYALTHTRIIDYTSLKQYNLRQGEYIIRNTNKLLSQYQGCDGLKTGHTSEAKYCLTATAHRHNLRLIAVVMGSPQVDGNFRDAAALLDYGFNHYAFKTMLEKGFVCGTVKVKGGVRDNVTAITSARIGSIYLKGQEKNIRVIKNLDTKVQAPVKKGQKLGQVLIYNDQQLLKRVDAVALRDVARASLVIRIIRAPGTYIIIFLLATIFYIRRIHLKEHKKRKFPKDY